jgi:hypothetical protein
VYEIRLYVHSIDEAQKCDSAVLGALVNACVLENANEGFTDLGAKDLCCIFLGG